MKSTKKINIPSAEQLYNETVRLKTKRRFSATLRSTVSSVIVAAAVIVLLSWLLSPTLNITGSGMSPTLTSGQTVLCSKFSEIRQGDIIAFYHNKKILIKRVIGIPGDTIEITEDGSVIRSGEILDESYITEKALGECDISFPYSLEKDRFFVMGDSRTSSIDSRYSQIGSVSAENIIGRVYFRIFPLNLFGAV